MHCNSYGKWVYWLLTGVIRLPRPFHYRCVSGKPVSRYRTPPSAKCQLMKTLTSSVLLPLGEARQHCGAVWQRQARAYLNLLWRPYRAFSATELIDV